MTAQGHPHTIFRRALEAGNLVAAELAAHQLRGLSLADALELTALVSLRDRERGARYGVRWLARWLEETRPTLDEAVLVIGALRALGGLGHERALAALRLGWGPASAARRPRQQAAPGRTARAGLPR